VKKVAGVAAESRATKVPETRALGARVSGVVLAAGSSSRFGRNKLLLSWDGESLARRACRIALDAGLDPVVAVLGHDAERVREELNGLAVCAVVNDTHALGMNTSLRIGVAAVPEDAVAAVVLLADMPRVTAAMVERLVRTFAETGAPLVASDYEGVHAPPTLYARALFPELGGPSGDGCGKGVVRRHEDEVVGVAWPASALADVDREEDWERAGGED
jgi:molybdenum cofactor cytidylyltransferase